jgi:hypothetical protein
MLKPLRIPSLVEFGVALGRIPRFSGRTGPYWTDLHHSLVVEMIAAAIVSDRPKRFQDKIKLYSLLHDAHEYWWGDIPTPFKSDEIRRAQKDADVQIRAHYGIPEPSDRVKSIVKEADDRAFAAEAYVTLPPDRLWYFLEDCGRPMSDRCVAEPEDMAIVEMIQATYPSPLHTVYAHSAGVIQFVDQVRKAIGRIGK